MKKTAQRLLLSIALTCPLAACGANAPNLKPAFVAACGAARTACAFVSAACTLAPSEPTTAVESAGGEVMP